MKIQVRCSSGGGTGSTPAPTPCPPGSVPVPPAGSCKDCAPGKYSAGGWQRANSVNGDTLLGSATSENDCLDMCSKVSSRFCAYQCNGCYSGTSLKPVSQSSFDGCFQYGRDMTAPQGSTVCANCPAGKWSGTGSISCTTGTKACTDATSGKCGTAPTFMCGGSTKCCPGCGMNNTAVSECDHGEDCTCLNCPHYTR